MKDGDGDLDGDGGLDGDDLDGDGDLDGVLDSDLDGDGDLGGEMKDGDGDLDGAMKEMLGENSSKVQTVSQARQTSNPFLKHRIYYHLEVGFVI